jgi:hypothetical protein
MKSSSAGLELEIILSLDESNFLLKNHIFAGLLNFNNTMLHGNIKREIPFIIHHSLEEGDNIEVLQTPDNVYFGQANYFEIFLYNRHGESLLKRKYCIDRFYGATGKVEIKVSKDL